jgi:prophage regulatory protein
MHRETLTPNSDADAIESIVRFKKFCAITGLGRTTVYSLIAKGRLPKPVKIGARACGFKASTVREFLDRLGDP